MYVLKTQFWCVKFIQWWVLIGLLRPSTKGPHYDEIKQRDDVKIKITFLRFPETLKI